MKLVSLNTWGGRAGRNHLLKYIESQQDAEIICFQEVWKKTHHLQSRLGREFGGFRNKAPFEGIDVDLFQSLNNSLPEHTGFFLPSVVDFFGIATFIHNSLAVESEVEHIIHGERGSLDLINIQHHTRNAHLIKFSSGLSVLNLHGVAGGEKLDSPEREIQTDRILKIVNSCKNPLIICGDFNLVPDSNALLKLEKFANLENWIKKSKIDSTRSSLYPKKQRYADYILTTKSVQCNKFSVPNIKISDHLPLVFYFSIDLKLKC